MWHLVTATCLVALAAANDAEVQRRRDDLGSLRVLWMRNPTAPKGWARNPF